MDEEFKNELVSCVEKSMREETFSKMKIELTDTTNKKGEGFMADLIFATVTGTCKNNKYKKVDLAIKIGKRSKELRESFPTLVDCYKRELVVYDTVLPAFRQFQLERNIANIFDAYPKCYGTFLSEDIEAVVLDNLKLKGYALHNKQLTMNLQHIYLVLENYAKFHALSYAFRDQHSKEFNTMTANYHTVLEDIFPSMVQQQIDIRVQAVLREGGRDDLVVKYAEETKHNELSKILAVLRNVPQESVITHGDCHNNNFLFEYKDNDEKNPLRVAIIDWQLSGIHSPVLDLSYFLYCSSSIEELSHLEELLKFYHSHLTDFMKKLGSDAQEVFPYSTLIDHWRKFSYYGLFFAKNVLHVFYILEEHIPVPSGNQESNIQQWKSAKLQNEDLYRERLISIFDNYFNFILYMSESDKKKTIKRVIMKMDYLIQSSAKNLYNKYIRRQASDRKQLLIEIYLFDTWPSIL